MSDPIQVQQALEQTQFTLGRESARRARLEKKYSEMEERGLVSPRLVTPRVVRYHAHARGWKRDDTSTTPGVQPSLLKVASARCGVHIGVSVRSYCFKTRNSRFVYDVHLEPRASLPARNHSMWSAVRLFPASSQELRWRGHPTIILLIVTTYFRTQMLCSVRQSCEGAIEPLTTITMHTVNASMLCENQRSTKVKLLCVTYSTCLDVHREVLEEARAKLGRESGDMAPVSSGEEAAVKSRDENADS